MPIKEYNPTSPGRRGMSTVSGEGLTRKRPEKALTSFKSKSGGRNNVGRITSRFKGGGISVFIEKLILSGISLLFRVK